jgi:DNA (cytosine-5)-methyltransferase 1
MKVGSDFSGVGAFDQALKRLGVNYETIFACDMDKYARDTFIHNYGEPKYYPTNVYEREIPIESLDIYMTSPPCQAFSLAGKRLGKDDKRGVLFFNSHEFIQVNKPRFFIFENVKGLLSDDGGRTFQEWINMLGGKSVNGLPVLFAHDEAVPYHLYWQVLNAKHHGVPQNRERVFLIGIRDDEDNQFQFPREEHLSKRLKDVLEDPVDDKYFLSDDRIGTITKAERGIGWTDVDTKNTANCVLTGYAKNPTDGEYLKIKSATSKGYEEAREGDSINFSVPSSETRRGRVGKGVAQTLDTSCNQAIIVGTWRTHKDGQGFREIEDGNCPTIPARAREDGSGQPVVMQLNQSKESGGVQPYQQNRVYDENGICPTLCANLGGDRNHNILKDYKIRRLTPRECFRLMDFPDTFTWNVSDSQAYKQAGNSIVVNVLYKILKQLPL